ncbi:MAG: universal stress protein [Gemmatimonadota bacterium]|nr:universal stress protein [Gemmatimonadota bacterium]
MFRNILLPVDLTPKNLSAVQIAADLARASGGGVVLLHVIETLDLPFEELREFYDRLESKAVAHMDGLADALERAGVPFEAHVVYGDRTERIVAFARARESDLIVMDSHRVEPGKPGRGPTTISYRVAIVAECPVLLIKGAGRRGRKDA